MCYLTFKRSKVKNIPPVFLFLDGGLIIQIVFFFFLSIFIFLVYKSFGVWVVKHGKFFRKYYLRIIYRIVSCLSAIIFHFLPLFTCSSCKFFCVVDIQSSREGNSANRFIFGRCSRCAGRKIRLAGTLLAHCFCWCYLCYN